MQHWTPSEAFRRRLSPAMRAGLIALLVLTYLVVAFYPFRWQPPTVTRNGAVIEPHSVRFPAPGLVIAGRAPQWVRQAIHHNQLDIWLRVCSFAPDQSGPARILTVSANPSLRNLTVGQEGTSLVVRLRRPGSTPNGEPAYLVRGVFASPAWHDIRVAVRPRRFVVWVDGEQVCQRALPARPLAGWRRGFVAALGNEVTGDRPWLGAIGRAVVNVQGSQVDYLHDAPLTVPRRYWAGFDWMSAFPFSDAVWTRKTLLDALLNLICFVPLGFLAAASSKSWRAMIAVVLACSLLSLGVELAQSCFAFHVPSVSDWLLNTTGAAVGTAFALRWGKTETCRRAIAAAGGCPQTRPNTLR